MAASRPLQESAIGNPSVSRQASGRPFTLLVLASCFMVGLLLALVVFAAYVSGLPGAVFAWVSREELRPWLEAALLGVFVTAFLMEVRFAVADPDRRPFRPRSLVQFRIQSLLLLTTVIAFTLGVAYSTGLSPGLVFVGWLYAGGPWSALLFGVLTRNRRPRQEYAAVCTALIVLVVLALAYSMISGFTGRGYDVTLLDLLHVTTILWCPQVLLYLVLRPLLAPQ